MCIERVLIPVLHVAHDAFWLYEYKVEGSGCEFNRKWGLVETDS